MWETLKRIHDKVEKLLIYKEQTRDCDNTLIACFWAYEIGQDRLNEMTAKDLLRSISDGDLPSSESIRRSRQKIQEHQPELRGKKYEARQAEAKTMQQNIVNGH